MNEAKFENHPKKTHKKTTKNKNQEEENWEKANLENWYIYFLCLLFKMDGTSEQGDIW